MKRNKLNGLEIKNYSDDRAELYIYGEVVSDEWDKWDDLDICPEDMINFLASVENVKNLDIYINSPGGSLFAGMSMYSMLKRHKAYKTTYIDGLAGSISSVLAFAGDKLIVPSNATIMIHKPLVGVSGNSNVLRKTADALDRIEESILNVYFENLISKDFEDTIRELVNKESWLSATEASKYFKFDLGEANNMVACSSPDFLKRYKNVPEGFKVMDRITMEQKSPNNILELAKAKAEALLLI